MSYVRDSFMMDEQEPSINFEIASQSKHFRQLIFVNCEMKNIAAPFQRLLHFLIAYAAFSWAASVIPNRRTVIITGANRGIGLAAAKTLAATNEWNIVMACRSLERAEAAKKLIPNNQNVEVQALDLSDLKSVKKFANEWGSRPLHVLACNAGIILHTLFEMMTSNISYAATSHASLSCSN